MKAFIKAFYEKAWRSVLTGWKYCTTKDDESSVVLTPEIKWSANDDKLVNYNSKALNVIFNGVSVDHIKLLITCESAKEAWEILQTAYEGT